MIAFAFVAVLLQVKRGLAIQSSFIRDCLAAHNDVRSLHGVPPLQWNTEIAVGAQKWANHLAAIDQMQHDTSSPLGENLFYMYGGHPKEACKRAVKNWYQELKNYDFVTPHTDDSTSHFSQVVWRATREIGIGTAQSKSGNFFLVARYDPKGNIDGTFNDNVPGLLPGDGQPSVSKYSAHAKSAQQQSTAGAGKAGKLVADALLQNQRDLGRVEPSILLPKRGKDFRVELRFPDMAFTEEMKNPTSPDYIETKRKITEAVLQTYEDDDDFLEAQVLSLRNGSVIATLGLLFSTVSVGHLNKLTAALGQERVGKFVVSPAYESAEALPSGFLKLTLPQQRPSDGACPQPCSDPRHCYKTGCLVTCCAFHPSTTRPEFNQHANYARLPPPSVVHAPLPHPLPPQAALAPVDDSSPPLPEETDSSDSFAPPPLPAAPLAPVAPPPPPQETTVEQECPGGCDDRCSPYCEESCCSAALTPPPTAQAQLTQPPPSSPQPGTLCPASCSFECYPECIIGCCEEEKPVPPCPMPCSALCAPACSPSCCEARKSAIHRYQQLAALRMQAQRRLHATLSSRRAPKPSRVAGVFSHAPPKFRPLPRAAFQRRPFVAPARQVPYRRQPPRNLKYFH